MARLWFLLASFGLLSTAAYSEWIDEQYHSKLKSVLDILWEAFTTEIRNKENVMIFPIQSVTDVHFMYDVADEETKKQIEGLIPAFEVNETMSADDVDVQFIRALSPEMSIKTIFHGTTREVSNRNLRDLIFRKMKRGDYRFDSFESYSDDADLTHQLLRRVGLVPKNETCIPRYCSVQEIVSRKPPFVMLTVATWNLTSLNITPISRIQWIENVEFAVSETFRPKIDTARFLDKYGYAEFQYPKLKNCNGRVLHLHHDRHFGLFLVIPSDEKMCNSSEDLWKNVQNVNLARLTYTDQTMFVSIPLFKVDANIDLRMKLNGTAFAGAFDQPSSRLCNASALQALEVVFSPKMPGEMTIPDISPGTPSFLAERPFFFALYHYQSQQTVVAGLVNSPWCSSNCTEMKKYHW